MVERKYRGWSRETMVRFFAGYFDVPMEEAEESVREYEVDFCHLGNDETFRTWVRDTAADCMAYTLYGEEHILEHRDACMEIIDAAELAQ